VRKRFENLYVAHLHTEMLHLENRKAIRETEQETDSERERERKREKERERERKREKERDTNRDREINTHVAHLHIEMLDLENRKTIREHAAHNIFD